MLNADDQETVFSLRLLKEAVLSTKPLILWIGAGSSAWMGYPPWKGLALQLRLQFFRNVALFDNPAALRLIETDDFPAFFEMCRELDRQRYYRFLTDTFSPRPETVLYTTFIDKLRKHTHLRLLTTNVDEALEQHLPTLTVFQRSDLSHCLDLLSTDRPFLGKLHGTRSAVETTIFATTDYAALLADVHYLPAIKALFTNASVVFVGYGVRDQYVIDLMVKNEKELDLFGTGPHFVVSADPVKPLRALHRIGYALHRYPDHRAALTILDFLSQLEQSKTDFPFQLEQRKTAVAIETSLRSEAPSQSSQITPTAYYISDLKPPGTWSTSQTAQVEKAGGEKGEITVGLGFTDDEVLFRESTALHDLVVGLICFDNVYLPLSALAPAHSFLGSELFWEVVTSDAIRFVHMRHEPAIVFRPGELVGSLSVISLRDKNTLGPELPASYIRRQIRPHPGKEAEAEKLFADLEEKTVVFTEAEKVDLPTMIRGTLLMPRVARLLGFGDALVPTQAPRWLTFPLLRIAHLVHVGLVCSQIGIQAVKFPFGGTQLTSAAFGVQASAESVERSVNYVVSGRFNTDLGVLLFQRPDVIRNILKFRSSQEGERFRREVGASLLEHGGSEFTASVNAGLRQSIPDAILDRARDKLSSLLTEKATVTPVPAVWNNLLQSDDSTLLWRAKALLNLSKMCRERGIGKDDPCPCGSGDKLRLCCMQPLRR